MRLSLVALVLAPLAMAHARAPQPPIAADPTALGGLSGAASSKVRHVASICSRCDIPDDDNAAESRAPVLPTVTG